MPLHKCFLFLGERGPGLKQTLFFLPFPHTEISPRQMLLFASQKEESLIVTNNWYLVSKRNNVVQGPWLSGLESTEKSQIN